MYKREELNFKQFLKMELKTLEAKSKYKISLVDLPHHRQNNEKKKKFSSPIKSRIYTHLHCWSESRKNVLKFDNYCRRRRRLRIFSFRLIKRHENKHG